MKRGVPAATAFVLGGVAAAFFKMMAWVGWASLGLMALLLVVVCVFIAFSDPRRQPKKWAAQVALLAVFAGMVGWVVVGDARGRIPIAQEKERQSQARHAAQREVKYFFQGIDYGFSNVWKVELNETLDAGTMQVATKRFGGETLRIRKQPDGTWVAGCPTTDGGMVPLTASGNELAFVLNRDGSCPLLGPTSPAD